MSQIKRVLLFGGMVAVCLFVARPEALAQKKKDKMDPPPATDTDYKSIQKQKELPGTLVSVDTNALTIRVEYSHMEPNPKYKPPKDKTTNQVYQIWKAYSDLQIQMQKAALAKTPREALLAQQRIAQDMNRIQQQYNQMLLKGLKIDPNNSPFITVTNTKDYDLEVQDKVVYRRQNLALEYDDTGNVKTYTDKEKAELRGDDKTKPGYLAKAEDFLPGAEVKLYLTPPKKVEKSKDDDKDSPGVEPVARPTINMMLLTKEAPATPPSKKKEKKKS